MRRKKSYLLICVQSICLLLSLGCNGITVRKAGAPDLLAGIRASASDRDAISPRSLQTLRRYDLEAAYRKQPQDAFTKLQAQAAREPLPDLLFTLAEMSYLLGRDADRWTSPHASGFYYLSAGYAYHYLLHDSPKQGQLLEVQPASFTTTQSLPPEPGRQAWPQAEPPNWGTLLPRPVNLCTSTSPFDPRFRVACDLYNRSLAQCIRAAQRAGRLDPREELNLPTSDGKGFSLTVMHHGFSWKPDEFGPLLFCEDFDVVGFENFHRSYGLGVPMIGTRAAAAPAPETLFYPRNVSFPVTAFFRFEGTVADLGSQRSGRLELYNPLHVQNVSVRGKSIPLESDLTTPLAYFLSRTDLEGIEYVGFLRADRVRSRAGIYLFEPYQPGKIPVVMVHGLLSSPLTWAPVLNDLRADPVLRSRYQFMFYLYPTGNPYLATAADLRQTLTNLRADLDPHHHDAAFDQMVLVGHSMGGLISKLLTIDSGEDFWKLVSKQPLDSLKLKPDTRAELERIYYFEPQPYVRRVVFLATPHQGSKLSPAPLGRLASKLVKLPQNMMAVARDAATNNPDAALTWPDNLLPTSVDLLAPKSPALSLLGERPRSSRVHYHSVVGKLTKKPLLSNPLLTIDEEGDGVVPYSSAHLDPIDSEIVVPAEHSSVHHHPLTVLEIRRVLLEHLRDLQKPAPAVQQAGFSKRK